MVGNVIFCILPMKGRNFFPMDKPIIMHSDLQKSRKSTNRNVQIRREFFEKKLKILK